jgi:hypothetical protein
VIDWLLSNPEVGWLAVLVYLAWEIRGPKGQIKKLSNSIQSAIVVIRAIARANQRIDAEEVDGFLVDENGSEPSDFIDFDGTPDEKEKISVDNLEQE